MLKYDERVAVYRFSMFGEHYLEYGTVISTPDDSSGENLGVYLIQLDGKNRREELVEVDCEILVERRFFNPRRVVSLEDPEFMFDIKPKLQQPRYYFLGGLFT